MLLIHRIKHEILFKGCCAKIVQSPQDPSTAICVMIDEMEERLPHRERHIGQLLI